MTGPAITLDPTSKDAPYTQIKLSIARLVADGDLREGDSLPPIRQLAGDLGTAPNTVARAYRELEADGVLRSSGRRGTVVAPRAAASAAPARLRGEVDDMVQRLRNSGADAATILSLVNQALSKPSN